MVESTNQTKPNDDKVPAALKTAVYQESVEMTGEEVRGYDFNKGLDYEALFKTMRHTGFQATNLGLAIEEINKMIKFRLSDLPVAEDETEEYKDPEVRKNTRCKIFLGFTSNMASCGMREYIRYLCQHKMIDSIVTTCGGIEEDIMKCMAPHLMGDFALPGKELRAKGINRIGNLLVPNKNYSLLEEWFLPLVQQMFKEQKEEGKIFGPSKIIARIGEKINNEDSIYYWCWKNNIPVYCPAFTDGALGDVIYFNEWRQPGFVCDIVQDVKLLNDSALAAKRSGMIILGGGVVKHHICNANLMRNGADYSVFVNTASEFDGSDAGARPDEAISWGKISLEAKPVKLYAECSLVLPIIIGESFVRNFDQATRVVKDEKKE